MMILWPDAAGTPSFDPRNLTEHVHTMIGRKRLDHLHACLDTIVRDDIPGDLIETGVWRGGATIFMRAHLMAHGVADRTVWVADSFEGVPPPSCAEDAGIDLSVARQPILAIDQARVRALFARYGVLDAQVRFLPGWFRDTLPAAPIERLALLRLDGDLYESTMDALDALYDRVSPGGFIVIDDYGAVPSCRRAVEEFRAAHAIAAPLETIDWGGVAWRKPPLPAPAAPRAHVTVGGVPVWVPPGHYYSPIVDPAELRTRFAQVFDADAPLPGIELGLEAQVALLRRLAAHYPDLPFGDRPVDGLRYGYDNANFAHADAILRACMIRELQPRRIVEVGCGHSSAVILDVNERFFGGAIACTFIEPHPELLRALVKPGDRFSLLDQPVQDVDPALFESLEAGDFLLIDSTHVSKAGSDVNHHVFKILPALAPGVVVFFHDVFNGFEYPPGWFFDENRSWNEIYLLRAFLAYNREYEIVLFTEALEHHHPGLIATLMPLAAKNLGGSLWLRRTAPAKDRR
ncbi:MAG: class I SAM-dependent methyltransferase, partial [Proteobacteria bacterium]|nr:class I SAM-dependent methyltransferase [Pseudomonadota bacterium]